MRLRGSTNALSPVSTLSAAAILSGTALVVFGLVPASASPGQTTSTLRTTTAADLATVLATNGAAVSAAVAAGNPVQLGSYSGVDIGQPGITSGVALTTGSLINADPASPADVDFTISSVLGPNTSLTTTGDLGGGGDADLEALNGGITTYDAASLTFVVTPNSNTIELRYLFASEEYAGWSAQDFTDAFGIWVNGVNCALVPGTNEVVGTESINATSHSALFFPNFTGVDPAAGAFDTEFNGFTAVLSCTATVTANAPNTVKIAIADTVDGQLDSTVLLAADSLRSVGQVVPAGTPTPIPTETATPAPKPAAPPADKVIRPRRADRLAVSGTELPVAPLIAGGALLLLGAGAVVTQRIRRRSPEE